MVLFVTLVVKRLFSSDYSNESYVKYIHVHRFENGISAITLEEMIFLFG